MPPATKWTKRDSSLTTLQEWVAAGNRRDSVAVLYRSNAQSRVFEERLLAIAMPYRVYGGLRFFERAEIKDALAYLRLINNRDSDPAFERIVNQPTRGIGARTLQPIRDLARAKRISLWNASAEIINQQSLPARAASAVQRFREMIDAMANATCDLELGEVTDHVLTHSGLLAHFQNERGERAQGRVENLEELVSAARNFGASDDADDEDLLSSFLANAALGSRRRSSRRMGRLCAVNEFAFGERFGSSRKCFYAEWKKDFFRINARWKSPVGWKKNAAYVMSE